MKLQELLLQLSLGNRKVESIKHPGKTGIVIDISFYSNDQADVKVNFEGHKYDVVFSADLKNSRGYFVSDLKTFVPEGSAAI